MRFAKILAAGIAFLLGGVFAQAAAEPPAPTKICTVSVEVTGMIGAGTLDLLERAEQKAATLGCANLFLKINTPGGSLQTTRYIVERILASSRPYLCLVAPAGGHAGSAGAIILQACHINGALASTNLGAATPILGNGQDAAEDLRKKIINDTVSWLEGIANLRNRNKEFVKEIVTEAKSVSAEEALRLKAIDILSVTSAEFLEKAEGRSVKVAAQIEVQVSVGEEIAFTSDARTAILQFISDPEIAYMLFLGSLGLLYFEITHPGMILPGVVGAIGLILSLTAFHKLEVVWGALLLLLLGIGLLIAEVFVPAFGVLGIGGLVSFVIGSVLLFDFERHGYTLPWPLIGGAASALALVFLGLGYLALKVFRLKARDNEGALLDSQGVIKSLDASGSGGQMKVFGELWNWHSEDSLLVGDSVVVIGREGLVLKVKKINTL